MFLKVKDASLVGHVSFRALHLENKQWNSPARRTPAHIDKVLLSNSALKGSGTCTKD